MTITTFKIDSGNLTVVANDTVVPLKAVFTLEDGVTEMEVTTGTTVGNDHTFSTPVTEEGVYQVEVFWDPTGTTTTSMIDMTTGVSCFNNKVLNENYDCNLLQLLTAIEKYIFDDYANEAIVLYNKVLQLCAKCYTTATEDVVNATVVVENGIKTVQ